MIKKEKLSSLLDWEKSPLIPVIIQDETSFEVLMLGFMNKEALELSLNTRRVHYFSRTKNRIWCKGETSGHFQYIKDIKVDCDNDSLLILVQQVGVACHTGSYSCFFKGVEKSETFKKKKTETLDSLYDTLLQRKGALSQESYTATLFEKGMNTICKKITEEVGELICEFKDENKPRIIYEMADLLYHMMVGLAYFNIHPNLIFCELERRFNTSGIEEKRQRQK